jgi:hypothetical protein
MDSDKYIGIEVAYALPDHAYLIPVKVLAGATIKQGIESSGILEQCMEIDLARNKVGIFSKLKNLDTLLSNGDRIEIYHDLKVDPKEARRKRAAKIN